MESAEILKIEPHSPVIIDTETFSAFPGDFHIVLDCTRCEDHFKLSIDCKHISRAFSITRSILFRVITHFQINTDNQVLIVDWQRNSCNILDGVLLTAIAHCRAQQLIEGYNYAMNHTGPLRYVPVAEAKQKSVWAVEERCL